MGQLESPRGLGCCCMAFITIRRQKVVPRQSGGGNIFAPGCTMKWTASDIPHTERSKTAKPRGNTLRMTSLNKHPLTVLAAGPSDITNCMENSPPWEADSHSDSQETSRLLWNLKAHKNPPLVPILSQINPVHILPPYLPKIHSNIILPSMPRSYECSFPSGNPTKILYAFLIPPVCYMPHPSHPPWHAHKLWSPSLCRLLQPQHFMGIFQTTQGAPVSVFVTQSHAGSTERMHKDLTFSRRHPLSTFETSTF
jgi:hypothetical protein